MKIVNKTRWKTAHLKAILQRAAEQELEPVKRKALHVTVSYTRGAHSSGCAYIKGRYATVRIRHPYSRSWRAKHDKASAEQTRELVLHFASVAVHEFAHIRGMDHQNMPANYKWSGRWREYVAWAAAMPLEVQPVKTKAKVPVDAKLEHARKMLKLAATRVKRAQTIAKKWKAKERYYLRAMAARAAAPIDTVSPAAVASLPQEPLMPATRLNSAEVTDGQ